MCSLGYVAGVAVVHAFARNPDFINIEEDVWGTGGTIVYPTVAGPVTIFSDDAEDAPGMTGAFTVTVIGLDAAYNVIEEVITMNGTTPVLTTLDFLRVNHFKCETGGTAEANVGNITAALSGNVQACINSYDGVAHGSHYTIPAGHTAHLSRMKSWQGKDNRGSVVLKYREFGKVWRKFAFLENYRNQCDLDVELAEDFPEKTDIKMTCTRGDEEVGESLDQSASYILVQIKN